MILITYPPNFEQIANAFPGARAKGVLFAYGENIHNPSNVKIAKEILAHEYKHCARQFAYGVTAWWNEYINDANFRYYEELLAHGAELLDAIRSAKRDRNLYAKLLDRTAHRLIAPLYDYRPPPSLRDAMQDLNHICASR